MNKKTFDPKRYGMIICQSCRGQGFIEDHEGRNVCSKCGGFGLIKNEENSKDNNEK